MIAVMAYLTLNGTYKIFNPGPKATPTDPTPLDVGMRLASLEEVVQTQAERIDALEEQERRLVDLLEGFATGLRNIRD